MLADIIIVLIVALVFGFCLRKVIAGMKNGGCDSCGGNCAGCGHQCHTTEHKKS